MGMMSIWFSKKGFFFTMAGIALSIILILSFRISNIESRSGAEAVVASRVLSINDFLGDAEKNVQKGLYYSSRRAFFGMQEYVAGEEAFIPNVREALLEELLNGTINGVQPNATRNATFTLWIQKMQQEAAKVGISANVTILSLSLGQQDPWNINITAVVLFNVTDRENTVSFGREKEVSTRVSIIGLEDPLYEVKTVGLLNNTIRQGTYAPFVSGGAVTNLLLHTNHSMYTASVYSPTYLMRLAGNLTPSPFGIESLVDVDKAIAHGVTATGRSVPDVIYFGTGSTTDYRINDTPLWFKIDADRLNLYGVTNITI